MWVCPPDAEEAARAIHSLAVGLSIDFAQDTESFEVDPDVLTAVEALSSAPLVSAEVAIAHFNASMVASRAGSYEGYLEGDHEGLDAVSGSKPTRGRTGRGADE